MTHWQTWPMRLISLAARQAIRNPRPVRDQGDQRANPKNSFRYSQLLA
jgi:hypothetical protein